jgi:hypothetical protein
MQVYRPVQQLHDDVQQPVAAGNTIKYAAHLRQVE